MCHAYQSACLMAAAAVCSWAILRNNVCLLPSQPEGVLLLPALVDHLQPMLACCCLRFIGYRCCLQLSGDYDSDGEMPSSSASTRNKAKLGLKGGKKGRGDPSKPGPAVGGAAYRMSEWPPDTGPDGQLEARPDNVRLSAAPYVPLSSTAPACIRACLGCCAAPAVACFSYSISSRGVPSRSPICTTEARLKQCEHACCCLLCWSCL